MESLLRKLCAALLLLAGSAAHAGWEFGAGLGDEIFGETPVTAQLSYQFGGRYEQVVSLVAISERESRQRDISPNTVLLSYLVRIPIKRFYLGLGVAAASDTSPVISSNLLYTQTVGFRISERWLLEARHVSNAGREGRNIGENLFNLIYRFH